MGALLSRWIPALAWAVFLLWLGHRPPSEIPSGPPGFDKIAHAGAYAILGMLAAWAARRGPLLGMIVALFVGGLDEWGQSTVAGRYPDWLDLAADGVGGAIGGFAARWLIARQSD